MTMLSTFCYLAMFLVLILSAANGQQVTQGDTGPKLLLEIDPARLPPEYDGRAVRIGVFIGVEETPTDLESALAEATLELREAVGYADMLLEQCNMSLVVEAAQVVLLPERLLYIAGNRRGSFGGHPPPHVSDPERFSYDENERLTPATRKLFAYGKRFTSPNAISVFVVGNIEYYIGEEQVRAGGLSFPPNKYHHPGDYPHRNSVLLVGFFRDRTIPGISGRTLAHELGHMLLNAGLHDDRRGNLMGAGRLLLREQCVRMQANLDRLYGEERVADPGRP